MKTESDSDHSVLNTDNSKPVKHEKNKKKRQQNTPPSLNLKKSRNSLSIGNSISSVSPKIEPQDVDNDNDDETVFKIDKSTENLNRYDASTNGIKNKLFILFNFSRKLS